MKAMFQSYIPHLKLLGRGKVRDIYEADDQHLLIVATDRLSAYDVIMPNPIPGKGEILTSLSNFWFDMMSDLVPNHLTKLNINSYISDMREIKILEKRSIIVKKLKPLPIESVVRGYLIGSGWRDYEKNSEICGIKLPKLISLKKQKSLMMPKNHFDNQHNYYDSVRNSSSIILTWSYKNVDK